MGVYIPSIKTPEKCSECRNTGLKFAIDKLGLKCPERKEIFGPTEADIKGIRRTDCPLVSVKEPHGRLIDADKLLQFHGVLDDGIYYPDAYIPATAIKSAPTTIPAEEGQ